MGEFPNKATQFKPGHGGRPKGTTKAQMIGKLVDMVLAVPLEDIEKDEDGLTNLDKLKVELTNTYRGNPLAYMMRLWYPIAGMVGKTNLQIDIAPKQAVRIVLTNGNGEVGGNGEGKVIDVEPAKELNEGE